jgi:hypothetical protein
LKQSLKQRHPENAPPHNRSIFQENQNSYKPDQKKKNTKKPKPNAFEIIQDYSRRVLGDQRPLQNADQAAIKEKHYGNSESQELHLNYAENFGKPINNVRGPPPDAESYNYAKTRPFAYNNFVGEDKTKSSSNQIVDGTQRVIKRSSKNGQARQKSKSISKSIDKLGRASQDYEMYELDDYDQFLKNENANRQKRSKDYTGPPKNENHND